MFTEEGSKGEYCDCKDHRGEFVVYLTAKQLDDILSNKVSRMIPVIEHIRTTVQEA